MATKASSVNPLEDYSGFLDELQKETPRAAALIGAAFLDGWLRTLLANFMVTDNKAVDRLLGTETSSDRPLSSFSSRISAAYCLGLISKDECDDLDVIRKIRNRFAHGLHGLSFDDTKVADWCSSLLILQKLDSKLPHFHDSPYGDNFVTAVILLVSALVVKAENVKRERQTTPKGF